MAYDRHTIIFEGGEYPARYVKIADEDGGVEEVLVATEHLQQALLLPDGEFKNAEAKEIDEYVACYVEHEALTLPEEELAALVENEYYKVPSEAIRGRRNTVTLNAETVFALAKLAMSQRLDMWDDAAYMAHYIEKEGDAVQQKGAKDALAKLYAFIHGVWDDTALLGAVLEYQTVLRILNEVEQQVKARGRR